MKILLVSNMYPSEQKPYAGIFVKNQYEAIQDSLEEGESVDIFYMVRTFTGPIGSLWKYFLAFIRFIPHYFKPYQILHLHYFYPLIICAWIYKLFHPKTHILVTFHGSDVNKQLNGGLNQKLFHRLSQCIDLGIPVGLELQKAVQLKLTQMPTKVLCAGVNQNLFYPSTQSHEKRYDFTFVGTFEHRKGLDLYVEAIRQLGRHDLHFCFIGSGPLEHLIHELGQDFQVTLLHDLSQDQIRAEFYASRFQILCSRSEPFGLVVSEAMFCGTPSLVTPSGGMPEQVQDGINGFIASEISSLGILELLQRALALEAKQYQEFSQTAILNREKFSLESVVAQQIQIYRSLIQGQSPESLID